MRCLRRTLLAALLGLLVVPAAGQAQAPACPCTVFGTEAPFGDALVDQPVEVGMKLRSDEDGYITALRFYKQPNNTGKHVGHLWTQSGQMLAEVEFTNETASGWQEETLPVPVPISRDTIHVTSYHAAQGRFGFSGGYFDLGKDRPPLHAPASSLVGGNGVYRYGASAFPDQTFNSTNYWVDAVFERTIPPDTRPPRVSATSPAAGATGVPTTNAVSATFDEPVNPLTVNAGSFTLTDGAGNPVLAQVAFDSATRRATLTPQAPLAFGKTYTATVKSGNGGVTDVAGNQIAADHTWSFSTPAECPCTAFAPTDAPTGDAVQDQAVEVGMRFRSDEDGFVTSLRFYKQPSNTGTHVGHLWSGTGQLLAAATYANETASGWQQVDLPNPVPVTKDTTYITSYHAGSGRYAFTPGYFSVGLDRAPMRAPRDGLFGGNGVYRYGASAFPDQTFNATNYWVDATFERTIPPDVRGPTVTDVQPAAGANDVSPATNVTATFDEQIAPTSVTSATFTLRDGDGNAVAADVGYDAQTRVAKLDPQAPLAYSTSYTARLKGGAGGVADVAGNPLAADKTWSFTTSTQPPGDGPGGPIAVITDPGDPFGRFYSEILRAEGLNAFDTVDGPVSAATLAGHDTVLLADGSISDAEVASLTSWVQSGGNLIAMRPDKKLAGLLGLSDLGGTRTNQYLKVDNGTAAGAGIDGQTLQFHGTADRYSLAGGTALARLYSDSATATPEPAVTLRDVGTSGGQAAAFTFDLARSVVYTRQGNPAWAGDKRDPRSFGKRPTDMFYGAKAGDVQPDWVDMSKIDVPQADEQQRLLANMITEMHRDKAPLPRFWYLPRGEKAAIVLTGDDHAKNGTPAFFDRLKDSSPAGCSVADWECVRASSYLYPDTVLTPAQATGYEADGFEVGLHLNTFCSDWTQASLDGYLTSQLSAFAAAWPGVKPPVSNRTHCVIWSDWATEAKVEKAHGIRFDTNYYYNGPDGWLTRPGLLTGSGFPMRFADLDGSLIDVYQAMTQVTDETTTMSLPWQVDTLLDNALGSKAYYGAFTVLTHTDFGDHANANDVVAAAQERGVPIVSSAQMLDWLDGRNGSSFDNIAYANGRLDFSVVANPKARGLEAMLPAQSASGPLSKLTRAGQPVAHANRTVKGVEYAVFKATAGDYVATYAADTSPPDVSNVSATADADGHATVTWATDEPADSRVEYGRTTTLGSQVTDSARVTDHSVDLTGLSPNTTYRFRVKSTDAAGNAATSPATASPPASFSTPPGALVDSRTSEFLAGTRAGTYAGQSLDGVDGELTLQPAIAEEFEGVALPQGWGTRSWGVGSEATTTGGALILDGTTAYPTPFFDPPRVLEFTATFRPVNDEAVGFGQDLSDYPMAVFSTGNAGMPFQLYAHSGASQATEQLTPLPGVKLNVPHRFRIEWSPSSAVFFVDGAQVATHSFSTESQLRPVASDYGIFGAGVRVDWLREGGYAANGTFTSRPLDSGPGSADWQALTYQGALPSATQLIFETRSGATSQPDGSWSGWEAVGPSGTIASPDSRYVQYRATMASTTGGSSPRLDRVQIGFGAGTDRAPLPGSVSIAPTSPTTNQTLTATPTGFSDPDGDPLTYHYAWLRNGTPIAGATGSTLDLSAPGNGDRGDEVRVEVYATDGRGAASDAAAQTVTVANTAPTAGTVTVKPSAPATNDVVKAVPSGFADVDGGELTYSYQWLRNGTAIGGATGRTLDLSQPGNGDLGDRIDVDVRAVDSSGAASPAARGGQDVTGTNATPVEGTVTVAPQSPRTNQTLTASPAGFTEPDGEPLTYNYRWLRNGTPIAGATSATLDLSQAGNGDRGDAVRVEVFATDPGGRASDPVTDTVTVANTPPVAGTVAVKPSAPSSDDIVSATPTGFADADGDAVTYTYQWFRNGTAIGGATARTLDLSEPGNGDVGDNLEVEVSALDGNGGSSPPVRGAQTVSGGPSHAVASFGFEEAAGSTIADESGGNDGTLGGATRTSSGRFGRALSFDGDDDIATVPDATPLDLTAAMTLEAWVRPRAATNWRSVLFKESAGGLAYALYANSDTDVPSANIGGDSGARGTAELDPDKWAHLAATYDSATLRLFVNGAQVASRPLPDALAPGDGPLTFGANNVWGERFRGLIDEVRVYNRALSAAEIGADMGQPVVVGTPAPPPDPGPDAIGSFSSPQPWPIVPVHLALTSTGRVAAWDGFEAALNSERLWDPTTQAFLQIPTGRNLFCAGQVTIGSGRLLVVGGHEAAYVGIKDTNLYDPQQGTWSRGADMSVARWYPTATTLPDGRVFVVSGDSVTLNEPGMSVPLTNASNTLPSIYNPKSDTWTDLPGASRRMPLYPFMFVLPNGKLFDAGPDTTTRTFDLATGQWTTVGTSPIDGQSAVMYRPGKILKSGTWSDPEFPGRPVTDRAAAIDMTAASPAWREVAPMEYRRAYHTLTMLPDGKVLATGGQTATDGVDETTGILATEMWDPDTDTWTTMASHRRPRLYHSSAILLPDGRVLLAGGGAFGTAKDEKSAEIYSPPYLFKGPRPSITGAPSTLPYGQQFTVDTPDASRIRSASLVRMGSVTHNLDMDQRFMSLNMQAQTGSVRIDGPADKNVAPPGWYMVFLIDDQGVPSLGHIVKVEETTDTQAPSAPGSLSVTRLSASSQRLDWAASADNTGVSEYRVHRSTTPGFTPTAANRVATVTSGTTHTDSGLSAGTYYYRVVAADSAGNASSPSAEAVGDLAAPTVSVTAPAAGATVAGPVTLAATAADAVGVQSVQLRVDGANVGAADTTSPYSVTWDSRAATNGSHTVSAVARDAAGNARTSSNVGVTVSNAERVAAFGFDELAGDAVIDSFNDFDGVISGATRTTPGRFGGALSFDGINDWVSVPSDPVLTPQAGMTIEAWVSPSALSAWRSVVAKEASPVPTYALYASNAASRPTARVAANSDFTTSGPTALPLNTWSHLAMTWNGTTLRLFRNGTQVVSRSVSGPLAVSTGVLRLGGNSLRNEWFAGRIDEVRIYGRPLTAAEITADMNAPITP